MAYTMLISRKAAPKEARGSKNPPKADQNTKANNQCNMARAPWQFTRTHRPLAIDVDSTDPAS